MEQRYSHELKTNFFHSNHTLSDRQFILELGSFSLSWEVHSYLLWPPPGARHQGAQLWENSTVFEVGKTTSDCDEEWQATHREVPGAGCSLGRSRSSMSPEWHLVEPPHTEEMRRIPSFPCSGFWEAQAGLWGVLGCMEVTPAILTYTLPLPALDTHLNLLLFSSLTWLLQKHGQKVFKRQKPAKRQLSSLWFLCACLFACLIHNFVKVEGFLSNAAH